MAQVVPEKGADGTIQLKYRFYDCTFYVSIEN
jgi:hypothetical protein